MGAEKGQVVTCHGLDLQGPKGARARVEDDMGLPSRRAEFFLAKKMVETSTIIVVRINALSEASRAMPTLVHSSRTLVTSSAGWVGSG